MYSRLKFVGSTSKQLPSDLLSKSYMATAIFCFRLFTLISKAAFQDYLINALYDFMIRSPSSKSQSYQVWWISQDQEIKRLFDFMGRCASRWATILPRLVAIGTAVLEIFSVLKGLDSICPCFNSPLLFISKTHGMSCSHTRTQTR